MLGDITIAENIYNACGYTDMRKSIDGLAAIVQQQFNLDIYRKITQRWLLLEQDTMNISMRGLK